MLHASARMARESNSEPRPTLPMPLKPDEDFEVEFPVGDEGGPSLFQVRVRIRRYPAADAARVLATTPPLVRLTPEGRVIVFTILSRRSESTSAGAASGPALRATAP